MTKLTVEAKVAIVQKALRRGTRSLREVASECNIGYSTLQKYLRLHRAGLSLENGPRGRPLRAGDEGQTPPLAHILATSGLDEAQIGAYCRAQGIHHFQLTQWKHSLMAHDGNQKEKEASRKEIQALADENKQLKQELRRKEKALAETTALLVLKKKADLLWGEPEED